MDKIHWKEIHSPFIYSVNLKMLTDEGYIESIKCRLKGQSTKWHKPELRNVHFDKEFLKEWIEKKIFEQMGLNEISNQSKRNFLNKLANELFKD